MQIRLAETAGFGVERAVALAEQTARSSKNAVTLGPIIHNRHVVARFELLGLREISAADEAQPGQTVVIRAHGIPVGEQRTLSARGAVTVDATCPFVKKIHVIAQKAERDGRSLLIIGTPTHPEIIAIASYSSDAHVFQSAEALETWLTERPERRDLPFCLVSQTTGTQKLWESCREIAKKVCTNCEIFDTICRATEMRQEEAAILSQKCDAMVVVGDARSSNTGRLAMICEQYCKKVSLVDQADDLEMSLFSGANTVGITAGASTPSWIIKEVNNKMSEEMKVETAMEENFAELLEQSLKTLNNGDKVTGTVMAVGSTEVEVDLGTKHTAYIPLEDFSSDPNVKPEEAVKVGDQIEAIVVHVNDGEGVVRLSKKRLEAGKAWEEIEAAAENKDIVEGVVTEENKGGIVVNVKGIRVFVPASQSGVAKGGDLGELLKKNVQLRITEVNRARRRVVGSIRSVASEQRKAAQEKIWSEIEVGKQYHGTVKSLTSYGAFVDIGGVDGMVHVSELSWNRIKNPAEVVKVGDEIDVYVIALDPEKKKISLGYKTEATNPWTIFNNEYKVGDVVTVKIVKPTDKAMYQDLAGDTLAYTAMWLKDRGVYTGKRIAGNLCFEPEGTLTRGEFLVMAMKLLGAEPESARLTSGFADESKTPAWMRPYIVSAFKSGMVSGVTSPDGMVFRPSSNLTRAEAAVMLQNILDLPQSQEAAVFSEDCAVPVWAQASVSALESAGISIPVTTSAENLTRREAAELLYECWTLCQNRETAASRLSK